MECPNCQEPTGQCVCIRNKCIRCGEPVGNITFTVCDDCWEKEHPDQSKTMDKIAENKAFNAWWGAHGYGYKPQSENEAEWLLVVKYWAWKGWDAAIDESCDACKDAKPAPSGYYGICSKCGRQW